MDIQIKDYDGNVVAETNSHMLARSINIEQYTELFDDFLNLGGKGWRSGQAVGMQLRTTHRTLQRSAIAFCLGLIAGISEQEYTDARNETAIETAKKIAKMVDDGELQLGAYV